MTTSKTRIALSAFLFVSTYAWAAKKPVELVRASAAPAEASLLNIHITVFDHADDFIPEVRRAEARYLPVLLKQTLQTAGFWGTVRVVPDVPEKGDVDLDVSGAVRVSHGGELKLEVRAIDATGKVWLDKDYKAKPDASAYLDKNSAEDPFREVYHRIANDLSKKYKKLKAKDVERIRTLSRLRFAADLAPDAFADYLVVKKKNRFEIARLPSRDDPMMERVTLVRDRNGMFIDTVDSYYVSLFEKMRESYRGWRSQDYWQREAMKNGPPTATGSGGRNAPWGVLIAGDGPAGAGQGLTCGTPGLFGNGSTREDERRWEQERRRTHLDVLRELGESLASDVTPLLVEVDGNVTELTGSVETQYVKWRTLLRKIFAAETGLPVGSQQATSY
ncbi:MAG: hypothetical protein BMS9Abin37_3223 [Acidobacteriota bacterium]|nr:MAG: hypothetical protein BMS9Abin37_3223 [Acidobacteriota bacterium]